MKKTFSLLCLFCSAALCAQQIQFTAQNAPEQTPFAQPFDVRFELAHTPGYAVELDKESLPPGFELLSAKQEILSPGTQAYELSFMPFTLGVSTFTAVNFMLKDTPGGNTLARAASDPVHIRVNPVKFFDEQTLRDIRPPYIPAGWMLWVFIAVVLALIVYFVRRFWRDVRAGQAAAAQKQEDTRPADVIALSKLQLLLQSGLWEKAQYKLFYIELGDILREYFLRRFGLDVSADTSAELLRRARGVAQLAPLLQALRDYLTSSDLVKFAKVTPDEQTMRRDVGTVQTLVKRTSPQPEELAREER